MIIYLQWAKAQPEDWMPLNIRRIRHVRDLPRKEHPGPSSTVDNNPGWVNAINCQGITFAGYDHYSIEIITDGVRISGWFDDPEDWGDIRYAVSWELYPPAPDAKLGGKINTVQKGTFYGNEAAVAAGMTVHEPWENFVMPPASLTLDGIWLSDELYTKHRKSQTQHGWREWV